MTDTSVDMLVFGAHPDDAEIGMGGTIAKYAEQGYRIALCDLTLAEMSSNGDVHTRQQEAETARRLLGAVARNNLELPDRGLVNRREHVEPITLEIRKRRPRIVFAPYWIDRHPDHVMCSRLVQEAVFNAKLRKWLPDVAPWTVEHVLFYYINDLDQPVLTVDVTEHYERKREALLAYESQFKAGTSSVSTPLNQGYIEQVEARDRVTGQKHLVQYAEGFATSGPFMIEHLLGRKN